MLSIALTPERRVQRSLGTAPAMPPAVAWFMSEVAARTTESGIDLLAHLPVLDAVEIGEATGTAYREDPAIRKDQRIPMAVLDVALRHLRSFQVPDRHSYISYRRFSWAKAGATLTLLIPSFSASASIWDNVKPAGSVF